MTERARFMASEKDSIRSTIFSLHTFNIVVSHGNV